MKLLLDTNAVIAVAVQPEKVSKPIRLLLADIHNELSYSVTALWEITIKNGTRRSLRINPFAFRVLLQENGFRELSITAEHTLAVNQLPRIHGDPFDRILIAQAMVEGMTLVTSDREMLDYTNAPMLPL